MAEPNELLADLPPVDAPPDDTRAELVAELVPVPDDETQEDLHNCAVTDYQAALDDRVTWEGRLAIWEEQYYGDLPEKTVPWPGCSNMNVPLTMLGVETLKPRLVEAILGSRPIALAIPTEATDEDRTERVGLFLNWQLETKFELQELVPESAHLFLTPGTVVAKIYWKVDRRRRKYVRTFPSAIPIDEILSTIFGTTQPTKIEPDGTASWRGELPSTSEGGPPLTFLLRLKVDETETHVLVERDELVERPVVELKDPLDIIVPAKGGSDLQALPSIQERLWLSEDQLRRYVERGRFYKEAVDELVRELEPSGDASQQDGQAYREARDEKEGLEGESGSDVKADLYMVLEDYRRYDVDDDGYEEEIVQWVCPQLPGKILGWDYLDNVYAHGRRPYRVGRYAPIPFKFYGLSFPEVVRNLQEEINTIHNQRVDAGTLANLPWYLYRASATHSPQGYPLRPGEGIPIDNPQTDVLIPRWQSNAQWGQNEEALAYQYFERLTGLTDLSLGRQPSRVGATRTATGVTSLLSESGLRFKTAMEAFQSFWVGIMEDILALNQQYLPPGQEFRVTGKLPEFIRLSNRGEIAGKFDIRLTATTESLNKQVMREDATTIMQVLISPAGLQAGIVGMKGVQRSYRKFLRAYGEDPDLYLEAPPNEIVHTPEEEIAMIASGLDPRPSPGENVQLHLQTHMLQRRDVAVLAALGPDGMRRLDKHILDTMSLAQTQMMAQMAPQKAIGPQAQNAQIGRTEGQPGPTMAPANTNLQPQPAMGGGMGGYGA